jgi:hypothetical protein
MAPCHAQVSSARQRKYGEDREAPRRIIEGLCLCWWMPRSGQAPSSATGATPRAENPPNEYDERLRRHSESLGGRGSPRRGLGRLTTARL